MPLLLPGVLELSVRARYFSFHAFLLDEYRRRRMAPDNRSLSAFIKHREWEFGLAVLSCPHDCGSVPVGADRLRPLIRLTSPPYERGESVESPLGGYGLYYRSPLAEFGIVARAGTLLGDLPITVDVLTKSYRAAHLAAGFRSAVEATEYFQRWMLSTDPLPVEVLRDYAEVACLCRLPYLTDERDAVREAFFDSDPASTDIAPPPVESVSSLDDDTSKTLLDEGGGAIVQRRRSFAHYLAILDADPRVVDDESAYREALWSPPNPRSDGHALVAGQWSALIAKDVWQEAICSVWSEFCAAGLARSRALARGLTWAETEELVRGLTVGPPSLGSATATADLEHDLAAGRIAFDEDVRPSQLSLESLRRWTVSSDTATSGLVTILELYRRAAEKNGHGWTLASRVSSAWQPSIASVREGLQSHIAAGASVADTLWWLVERFVLQTHERIAYSKLPEFTFRFRWEEGLLRFFDLGVGRFPLASIRMRSLGLLSQDLGLWERDAHGTPALTSHGRSFVAEVLG